MRANLEREVHEWIRKPSPLHKEWQNGLIQDRVLVSMSKRGWKVSFVINENEIICAGDFWRTIMANQLLRLRKDMRGNLMNTMES